MDELIAWIDAGIEDQKKKITKAQEELTAAKAGLGVLMVIRVKATSLKPVPKPKRKKVSKKVK